MNLLFVTHTKIYATEGAECLSKKSGILTNLRVKKQSRVNYSNPPPGVLYLFG